MRYRLAVICLLVVSCGAASTDNTKQPKSWLVRYHEWLCKVSGYGCKLKDIAGTRSGDKPRSVDTSLMTYDLDDRQGRFIWRDCACWSPVPIGHDSLAVVTEEGIWTIPLDRPAGRKLVFKSLDVLDLIGVTGSPQSLLFLQTSKESGCTFQPLLLNTESFKTNPAPGELDLQCGGEWDDSNLVKPAEFQNGKALSASVYDGKYKIYLDTKGDSKPILPAPGASGECFDPVWVGPSTLAFISGQ
jgi:hypothetical protein